MIGGAVGGRSRGPSLGRAGGVEVDLLGRHLDRLTTVGGDLLLESLDLRGERSAVFAREPRGVLGDRLRDGRVLLTAGHAAGPDLLRDEVVLGGTALHLVLLAEVEGVALVDEDHVRVLQPPGLLGPVDGLGGVGVGLARGQIRQLVLGIHVAGGLVASFTDVSHAADDPGTLRGAESAILADAEACGEGELAVGGCPDHVPAA